MLFLVTNCDRNGKNKSIIAQALLISKNDFYNI